MIQRTLLLLLLSSIATYADLLAYVPLDQVDSQGQTRVYNSKCNYGENGTYGTVVGATPSSVGVFGSAINMSEISHRIEIGSGAFLPPNTNAFTILAWVKMTAPVGPDESRIVGKGSTNDLSWSLGFGRTTGPTLTNRGNVYCRLKIRAAPLSAYFAYNNLGQAANWMQMAFTFDGSTYTLYINGTNVDSASLATPGPINEDPSHELVIGNYRDDPTQAFTRALIGLIDDVYIFNETLTGPRLRALLANPYTLPLATAFPPTQVTKSAPVDIVIQTTGIATWSIVTAPAQGNVTFTSINTTLTRMVFSAPGNYTLRLSGFNGEICNSNVYTVMVTESTESEQISENSLGNSNVGAIVGGVLGAIIGCALLVALVIFLVIRRKKTQNHSFYNTELSEESSISVKVMEPLKKPNFEPIIYGDLLKEKEGSHNSDLEDLLLEPEGLKIVDVVSTSMPAHEIDKMAKALVIVFEFNEKTVPLILNAIDYEIAKTKETVQLFRPNSLPAKMFMMYAKMIGMEYLWEILASHINDLNLETSESRDTSKASIRPSSSVYQPSPTDRMTTEDEDMINKLALWNTAQKILVDILKSNSLLPDPLKKILQHVGIQVAKKFSGGATRSMGILFFMRYVCMAIQTPHSYGILSNVPSPAVQSELNLLSKIFQNLSNGVAPPEQQQFLVTNQPKVTGFLNEIMNAKIPETDSIFVPRNALMQSRYAMTSIIHANAAKITQELKRDPDNRELVEKFQEVVK